MNWCPITKEECKVDFMEEKFVLDKDTLKEFEKFSCNIEQIKEFTNILQWYIWQNIIENDDRSDDNINKLGTLINILSDLTCKENEKIDTLINKIKPLT